MVKVTALLIWLPVKRSCSVGEQRRKNTKSKENYYLLKVESLQVGDLVVVGNHGNQWPHKAQIVDIDMENKLALIRWEST
jgi:hypothetical protein